MASELQDLETWLDPLLDHLSPSTRRNLNRRLALDLRKRQATRINQQQNPDGTPFKSRQPRKADKSARLRRKKKMFMRLRQARHLKISADADNVAVGFNGRAARIARIHQQGLLSRVAPGGPLFQYPARRLLGFSDEDREWVLVELRQHLSK